jgi:hypothetical protein
VPSRIQLLKGAACTLRITGEAPKREIKHIDPPTALRKANINVKQS